MCVITGRVNRLSTPACITFASWDTHSAALSTLATRCWFVHSCIVHSRKFSVPVGNYLAAGSRLGVLDYRANVMSQAYSESVKIGSAPMTAFRVSLRLQGLVFDANHSASVRGFTFGWGLDRNPNISHAETAQRSVIIITVLSPRWFLSIAQSNHCDEMTGLYQIRFRYKISHFQFCHTRLFRPR